uniref:Uncharacterized protein n=1 Tax=Zea mays TaxID=4577 RepID=C4J548_MAIZE|nr:unknown [Zea mays]ACR36352.1 unknown [Zea mays]
MPAWPSSSLEPMTTRHAPSEGSIQAVVGSRKSLGPMPGGGYSTGLPSYLVQLVSSGSASSAGTARHCTWTEALVEPV